LKSREEVPKQQMREESERLVKEALERKSVAVTQGGTRIDARCGKCGSINRLSASPRQLRVPFTCKDCGQEQKSF
jgi:predicted RNA-binding Zn-ribbon protein involved in translation (DUF1610 family)